MKLSATPCPTPAAHQGGQQPRDLGESLEGFPVVLDSFWSFSTIRCRTSVSIFLLMVSTAPRSR